MKTNIIDTHFHVSARSANDYEILSLSNIKNIIEPGHRLRKRISSKDEYFELFKNRINDESSRAKAFGVNIYFGLGFIPSEYPQKEVFYSCLEDALEYKHNQICCYGEVELDLKIDNPTEVFIDQLNILMNGELPIIVSIPHINRPIILENMKKIFKELQRRAYPFNRIILDGLYIDEIISFSDYDFLSFGIPVTSKIDSQFVIVKKTNIDDILKEMERNRIDYSKIIFNSGIGYGNGDPWSLSKLVQLLKMYGVNSNIIENLFYNNASKAFNININKNIYG